MTRLGILRFQNKRLEKMQKKREEKKAAMLEKALFQGRRGYRSAVLLWLRAALALLQTSHPGYGPGRGV